VSYFPASPAVSRARLMTQPIATAYSMTAMVTVDNPDGLPVSLQTTPSVLLTLTQHLLSA